MLYVMLFCCYPFERPDDSKDQGDQQKYQRVGMLRDDTATLAWCPCVALNIVRERALPWWRLAECACCDTSKRRAARVCVGGNYFEENFLAISATLTRRATFLVW